MNINLMSLLLKSRRNMGMRIITGSGRTLLRTMSTIPASNTNRIKHKRKEYPEAIEDIRARVKDAQQDYGKNLKTIEELLQSQRGYVTKVPENAIVLCSGGLDSVVMISKLIEDQKTVVYPLFIRRGARAQKFEEKSFDFFMGFYKKRFPDNMKEGFKIDFYIPPRELKQNFPEAMALSIGHPLRNSTIQNLAVMYAVSLQNKGIEAKTIFSGSVAEDNTEPELGILSLRAQTLNTCVQLGDWDWQITSPLTDPYLTDIPLSKSDLIQYANTKFIPLEKTRTCFSNEMVADGTCLACKKRLDAFKRLEIADPLKYKTQEVTI